MPDKTVREIVTEGKTVPEYLEANGYDGLWDGDECGCFIRDLFPCDTRECLDCIPGHAITLPDGTRGIGKKPEDEHAPREG